MCCSAMPQGQVPPRAAHCRAAVCRAPGSRPACAGRKPTHTNHVQNPVEVEVTNLAESSFTPHVPKNGFQVASFEVDDASINWDDQDEVSPQLQRCGHA